MANIDSATGSVSQAPPQPDAPSPVQPETASPQRARRWLLLIVIALLSSGGIAIALWRTRPGEPQAALPAVPSSAMSVGPLEGKLIVYVRPAERGVESRAVDEPGALPVKTGGIMSLDVRFKQPAYTYLVWFDSEGEVMPLYPWNTKTLEVTNINELPPLRMPTKMLYSPLLGGGWTFGKQGGMETVLLLARTTPLPEGTKLGSLLADLPPVAAVRDPQEVVMFSADGGKGEVKTLLEKNRGSEKDALAADRPLRELISRLSEHFELIRAVRFAHEGE